MQKKNKKLVHEYGIFQAPTLVVIKNGQFETYANVSNIRKYVETMEDVGKK